MPGKPKTYDRILNCVPSRGTEQDWTFEDAVESEALTASGPLPASCDLRATWWEIGDQLDTGSCVGWATADAVLRWHFTQAGRLKKGKHLSVRFVWMAAKETDEFTGRPTSFIEEEGTSLKAALDIARKYGVVTDALVPFARQSLFKGTAKVFYATASQLRISGYFNLGREPNRWRAWIAENGPILTRLDVDATWEKATETLGRLDVYQPGTTRGGHAVALVGYTPDTFIVRNSWGPAWGCEGYAFATEAYAKAAFTEAYGVSLC